jgi:glycosyltransferase involved in cell wall biosynthesis
MRLILYSNQPIFRWKRKYYGETKNFIDFLAALAIQNSSYRLVVPCKVLKSPPAYELPALEMPKRVVEVDYYQGHRQAAVTSFKNAFSLRPYLLGMVGEDLVVAGPGPNSFLFWLSFLLPKSVRLVYFIRGDTLRTVRNIYHGQVIYPVMVGLVKLFRWRIRRLLANRRAIVFVYGDKLLEQYPGPQGSTHVISPLIDESMLRLDPRPEIEEHRPLRLLYVGRLSREKNIISLIEACEKSAENGSPFTLSIVGFGPLASEIRHRVAQQESLDWVTFKGFVAHGEHLIAELDKHDILCLPSRTEGLPRVVVEAFARGMPVLATRVGSLESFFPDQIKYLHGFGTKEIQKGISWCDQNRSKISAMGRLGQKTVKRFLIRENVLRVDQILRSFTQARIEEKQGNG